MSYLCVIAGMPIFGKPDPDAICWHWAASALVGSSHRALTRANDRAPGDALLWTRHVGAQMCPAEDDCIVSRPMTAFQRQHGLSYSVLDRLGPAGTDLRSEFAAGKQRRGLADGLPFRFGYCWPGPQPGAVAGRGGGPDEPGGKVQVLALQGQRAERAQAPGQAIEVVHRAVLTQRGSQMRFS